MPPKGSKKSSINPPPEWWEYAVLDLWLQQNKPSGYQNNRFHRDALEVLQAAYVGIDDAPDVESKDGCGNLGLKYILAYKDAWPSTIKKKIATWAVRECIPIGADIRVTHRDRPLH